MPKLINLDLDKIKELWETTSMSKGDIAKELNISVDTVRRRIQSNGWVRPDYLIEGEKRNRVNKINNTKVDRGLSDKHEPDELDKVKDLYYNTNLSKNDIAKELGIKFSRVKHIVEGLDIKRTDEHIKKVKQESNRKYYRETGYNFERKEIQDKIKQTKKDTYGNVNPFVTDLFKTQSMNTKMSKYGDKYYNNRKQAIETCIERYGVTNTMMVSNVIKKAQNSRALKMPEISMKISKTKLERFKNPDTKKAMLDRVAKTCLEKYGVSSYILSDDVKVQNNRISKTNRLFAEKSDITEFEYNVESYSYDLKKDNILIEIDPTITHNTEISYIHLTKMCTDKDCDKHKPISKSYHLLKSMCAINNGYRCIHVFDWDNWDKVIYLIQDKETLYARNLKIKSVNKDECKDFLNKYHLQNSCKGQNIRLGLYNNNELVQVMTFGKPRYNKSYDYELLRLCSHKDYKIVGGSERLFKHFIDEYKPKSVISYCDMSKFDGGVYSRLGFELKEKPRPSKHWSKGKMQITGNLLRQRGFDQIFNTNYGKGTDNELLMLQYGWLPVYDCGQASYIWKCENV